MAARGRLSGTERIRGELLKLGVKVSKRTVQKYMRGVRGKNGGGQSWATFVTNHAERMWACDFIQTHDAHSSYATIASRVGIGQRTAGTRILRARRRLRQVLLDNHGPE